MKGTSSLPGLISRCLRYPRISFERWFSSIPNLAADGDGAKPRSTNHDTPKAAEPGQRYQELRLKLQGNSSPTPQETERLQNGHQLQEAVSDIVRQGKQRMASARSREEVLLEFIDGLYKIKSLL
ncbi:MAG: hypothetical protein JW790_02630 [Dehalococcoidales bacterium]|nr:hypothetical protein [Dehalococcoidales bacterium]